MTFDIYLPASTSVTHDEHLLRRSSTHLIMSQNNSLFGKIKNKITCNSVDKSRQNMRFASSLSRKGSSRGELLLV